jgi:hypothetical protein
LGYPTTTWTPVATVHKLVILEHHIIMAKGAGAKQSTKGSSCGSGAASQGELQQQGPDDEVAAAYCCWGIIRYIRKKRNNFMGCSKLKVVIAIVCVCSCNLWSLHNDSQSMACSQVFQSPWIAVKFWGSCSLTNHWILCQICSKNSRLVMISYNIKSHNIITKLQICIIFLQPLIL